MLSFKQLFANKANAQKSTGPRTPDGKARARLNALKHGFFANEVVLPLEDGDEFAAFASALRDDLQPVGGLEELLATQVVASAWRLKRLMRIETGLFTDLIHKHQWNVRSDRDWNYDPRNSPKRMDAPDCVVWGRAFASACERGDSLDKLTRYQSLVTREFYRAFHDLQRAQAARPDVSYDEWQQLQNEPISKEEIVIDQHEPLQRNTGTGLGVPMSAAQVIQPVPPGMNLSNAVPALCADTESEDVQNEPISENDRPVTPLPVREGPGVGPVEQTTIVQNQPILTDHQPPATDHYLQNEPISLAPPTPCPPVPVPVRPCASTMKQNKPIRYWADPDEYICPVVGGDPTHTYIRRVNGREVP